MTGPHDCIMPVGMPPILAVGYIWLAQRDASAGMPLKEAKLAFVPLMKMEIAPVASSVIAVAAQVSSGGAAAHTDTDMAPSPVDTAAHKFEYEK